MFFVFNVNADPYCDPTSVEWKILDGTSMSEIQSGILDVSREQLYGSWECIQSYEAFKKTDIEKSKVLRLECKTQKHLRYVFWKVIKYWKYVHPNVQFYTRGGWSRWSHLLHRMIHDDFESRSTLDINTINDLDCNRNIPFDRLFPIHK